MRVLLLFMMLFPVLSTNAQTTFHSKIAGAVAGLPCAAPDEAHPVILNAGLLVEKDSMAVIVKCRIAPGWHIYDYVPPTLPYIASHLILKLPDDIHPVGSWKKTESMASAMDPGVLIYEKQAVFVHKAVKLSKAEASGTIKAGLYYQTCNIRQCLPPAEATFLLKY